MKPREDDLPSNGPPKNEKDGEKKYPPGGPPPGGSIFFVGGGPERKIRSSPDDEDGKGKRKSSRGSVALGATTCSFEEEPQRGGSNKGDHLFFLKGNPIFQKNC